jgi:Ras-related protein Rab-18
MQGPIKVVVVGDSDTGKTSIVRTYCAPETTDIDTLNSTVGVDFAKKHIDVDGLQVKLTIWDTAGQERFRSLCASYYRGARVVIVVYDVTNKESFDNVDSWLKEANNNSILQGVVFVLVGNKIDLDGERQVPREQGEELAKRKHAIFVETSARTHERVQEPFTLAAKKALERYFAKEQHKTVVRLDQQAGPSTGTPGALGTSSCC